MMPVDNENERVSLSFALHNNQEIRPKIFAMVIYQRCELIGYAEKQTFVREENFNLAAVNTTGSS